MEEGRLLIGICGGTSSGKTTLAKKILQNIQNLGHEAIIISQDSFYKVLSNGELEETKQNNYNFDHPRAIDFSLLKQVLYRLLLENRDAEIPVYDFCSHKRTSSIVVRPCKIIILEGIFIFSDPELCKMMHLKLFVDVDSDTRLVRRIQRDIKERGREVAEILDSYEKFVKPGFHNFILPFKRVADIIIPNGGNNQVAIHMVCNFINSLK